MSLAGTGVFAGRRAELARLNDLLARVRSGPRMAYLCGDPGIGKTRLAAEFARAAYRAGAIVLAGRCDREQIVPYQPFAEALKHPAVSLPAGTLRAVTGAGPRTWHGLSRNSVTGCRTWPRRRLPGRRPRDTGCSKG